MNTLENLLGQITQRGYRLNNLFQLESGPWRANVTDGKAFYEFGTGDTPGEALADALAKTTDVFA